jgi:hypothetical protein
MELVTFGAPDDDGLTIETCWGNIKTNTYIKRSVYLLVCLNSIEICKVYNI